MSEHPIEGLMKTTMDNLKEMVDVNTIVGDPVQTPDGLVIIPVSKVSFGFASGGAEFNLMQWENIDNLPLENHPFGGGSGAGVSLQPVGFIVVGKENIKLLPVDEGNNALSSFFDFISSMSDNLQKTMNNNENKEDSKGAQNDSYENE